ncbi:MAG: hypothetical protein RSA52_09620 [Acetivibrio sp.]
MARESAKQTLYLKKDEFQAGTSLPAENSCKIKGKKQETITDAII